MGGICREPFCDVKRCQAIATIRQQLKLPVGHFSVAYHALANSLKLGAVELIGARYALIKSASITPFVGFRFSGLDLGVLGMGNRARLGNRASVAASD
jgi:hypothetical protein